MMSLCAPGLESLLHLLLELVLCAFFQKNTLLPKPRTSLQARAPAQAPSSATTAAAAPERVANQTLAVALSSTHSHSSTRPYLAHSVPSSRSTSPPTTADANRARIATHSMLRARHAPSNRLAPDFISPRARAGGYFSTSSRRADIFVFGFGDLFPVHGVALEARAHTHTRAHRGGARTPLRYKKIVSFENTIYRTRRTPSCFCFF